jgi:hypothetical protein
MSITIPREAYAMETATGVMELMNEDLGVELELDSDEPTYYGNPEYVSNYPCLVSLPSDFITEHVEAPRIAEYHLQHRIAYVFQALRPDDKGFVDPYVTMITKGQRIIDWLAYSAMNNHFPIRDFEEPSTSDANWLVHIFERPWYLRIENEFNTQLRQARTEENLYCPLIEFTTITRWPFLQLSA